jgi:SAM-dependent methyltransferase
MTLTQAREGLLKGYVATPQPVVDRMVEKLFSAGAPAEHARVLDPGAGRGAFVDGIIRWCEAHNAPLPRITAVESDLAHVQFLRERYSGITKVEVKAQDFLAGLPDRYDYVVGNPPYVALTALSGAERDTYRGKFTSAVGRFDLYLLFFEQALRLLTNGGRLVFVTPEKYVYVNTAAPLRTLLASLSVQELEFLPENTFHSLTTYPVVTTLEKTDISRVMRVVTREGMVRHVGLRPGGQSWLPMINGVETGPSLRILKDACLRISCGVATGADAVFIRRTDQLDPQLRSFSRPTISGRDISFDAPPRVRDGMLLPYAVDGRLLSEDELGVLGDYLSREDIQRKLRARTCVRTKPWYAFHENPPMHDLLRPKLLCKDIGARPFFAADRSGTIIPRHSVYYLVPHDGSGLDDLLAYLNSAEAAEWLQAHCQRAANGFIRLQSHVLKRLPIPEALAMRVGASPLTVSGRAA